LLTLLGLIGPWAKLTSFFSASITGLDAEDGKYVGLFALGALVFLAAYVFEKRRPAPLIAAAILGLLIAGTAGYDLVEVSSRIGEVESEYATASVGWGLYACVLGGIAVVAGSLFTLTEVRKQSRLSVAEKLFPRPYS